MSASPNEFWVSCDAADCRSGHFSTMGSAVEAIADVVETYGWKANGQLTYCPEHKEQAA